MIKIKDLSSGKKEVYYIDKFILYYILLALGIIIFLGNTIKGFVMFKRTEGKVSHVTEIKRKSKHDYSANEKYYAFKFTTDKGIEVTFLGNDLLYEFIDTRKKVTVIYNPRNPQEAYVYSFLGFWANPLIFFFPYFLIISAVLTSKGYYPRKLKISL